MLGIIAVAMCVGVWELRRALAQVAIHVPLVPSLVGRVSMLVSAYLGGGQALVVTLGLTCVGILLWRIADGVLDAVRDIAGGFFVALYPSFLAGFAALLLAAPTTAARVFVFILVTVLSDIGGYAFGVLWGSTRWRRRSAPRSPGRASPARCSPAWSVARSPSTSARRAVVGRPALGAAWPSAPRSATSPSRPSSVTSASRT